MDREEEAPIIHQEGFASRPDPLWRPSKAQVQRQQETYRRYEIQSSNNALYAAQGSFVSQGYL